MTMDVSIRPNTCLGRIDVSIRIDNTYCGNQGQGSVPLAQRSWVRIPENSSLTFYGHDRCGLEAKLIYDLLMNYLLTDVSIRIANTYRYVFAGAPSIRIAFRGN